MLAACPMAISSKALLAFRTGSRLLNEYCENAIRVFHSLNRVSKSLTFSSIFDMASISSKI
jgi:hypothetical protein